MQDYILCFRWHQEAAVGRVCPSILGGGECDVHCIVDVLLTVGTHTGVNKKPKKFKTVWHGFRGILKLSGRVNQASLKLSAGFSNTVC